jgi:hypothetical protein
MLFVVHMLLDGNLDRKHQSPYTAIAGVASMTSFAVPYGERSPQVSRRVPATALEVVLKSPEKISVAINNQTTPLGQEDAEQLTKYRISLQHNGISGAPTSSFSTNASFKH